MTGKLIILGTPIGNLGDFSPRGVQTLKDADFIAAEDTRVTRKLLNYFGIHKPLVSYFHYNESHKTDILLKRILKGENCVIVSDAGMPTISDPGENLICECAKNNIRVEVVPGPSALIAALAVSALPTGRFTFEGFLSTNKRVRNLHLEDLKDEKRTMIFYEAPHKLLKTIKSLFEALGDRRISISREITKIYEEVARITLKEALEKYKEKPPKGECVIVIEGKEDCDDLQGTDVEDAIEIAKDLISKGNSMSKAAKLAASKTNLLKNDIYRGLLKELGIRNSAGLLHKDSVFSAI
ncbi:MAG: 16S rRNA (cytidine(1402)-2'-O)-methyltransferase [Oscillospiraceae bacterium]|nr:16S rRNA (cytidine(1402)-2'-O)-methyltransferase [Oscillospiraceae bacterium]